jgi:hypothetical protein
MNGGCLLRMNGAATNLEPFEAALESLNEGRAAGHTATSTYVDSVWPVSDDAGHEAELVWPDYGGEQIKTIISSRRIPSAWRSRITDSSIWLLMIRLQQTRVDDDIFSRPIDNLRGSSTENREVHISDQARMIELLQMLKFVAGSSTDTPLSRPQLGVLLTCWDETNYQGTPASALRSRLPLVSSFVESNWSAAPVFGLSALGKPLSTKEQDTEYVNRGPEKFGYVVGSDGSQSADLTLPIVTLLSAPN